MTSALHEPEDVEVQARLEWLRTQAVADSLPDFVGAGSTHLSLDFLKERQWVAVPMESASYFDEEILGYVLKAFEYVGDDRALAVQAEDLKGLPRHLEFRATPESLEEFNEFSHYAYLLAPFSMEFSILCTHEIFMLWAGPERLLEDALGGVAEARKTFDEFAAAYVEGADPVAGEEEAKFRERCGFATEIGEWLQCVAERYR